MGVVLLSDAVGANVSGLQNYSPEISPEILLDKYRDKFTSLEAGDKQVLLRSYHNQQKVDLAQQPASTPSIPLNTEQRKLYEQGVKLVKEGQDLEKKGTREFYKQAINKYQQGLKIAQELKLRQEEVEILFLTGSVYYSISDKKNALDYLNKALEISRELNKPVFEATILGGIGAIYTNTDEPREALSYLQQAQSIFIAHQKFHELAITYKAIATVHNKLGNTKEALDSLNKALKIYREMLKDSSGQADTLYDIGFVYSIAGETQTAINYYKQALEIQRQRRDLPAQARLLSAIGALKSQLGNLEDALKSLKEALELHQQVGSNLSDKAGTLMDIGFIYASQGNYQTAINYYNQAGKLYHQVGNTYLQSFIPLAIANVHINFSGDYQKALESLDEALKLQENDLDGQVTTINAKADIYVSQGNYQQGLDEYQKSLTIARSIPNPRSEANTLKKIALIYKSLGDYNSSIDTYNQVLDIYNQFPNKSEKIRTLLFISMVYQTQEKYYEALPFYDRALSLLSKDDYQSEIMIRHEMAKTHNFLKNYTKALEFANRALELSQQNSFREEVSLNILASVYSAKGEYQKSLDIYKKVLAYSRKVGLRIREALILGDMSITYQWQKNYNQAINTLNEELELRRELKDSTGEAEALYLIAINQRHLGNLEAALSNIQTTIKIVENIRGNVQSDELRTSYFATVQNYYKFYIDLLMQLHEKDPTKVCEFNIQDLKIKDRCDAVALHISERARARSLVELLKAGNVNLRKNVDPQLLAEERRLQNKLKLQETRLSEFLSREKLPPTELINKTNQEITNLLQESQQITAKIRAANPERAELTNPKDILQLPEIQQQLDKDTILLQYSLGKERSYLWVVTPNFLESYELPGEEKIVKAANDLNSLLQPKEKKVLLIQGGTPEDNAQTFAETEKAVNVLSEIILKPLTGKLGNKRLVIVADGILHQVSFAALNEPKKSPASTEYQPLVVNHEIVNLPSISSIATHRKKLKTRDVAPKTLAVLANPVFTVDDPRLKNGQLSSVETNLDRSIVQRNTNREKLDPLPGTKEEGEAILELVNSPSEKLSAFDFDANYNFATSKQLRQYRHLLFATHGIFDPVNPASSGIVLSLVDKQGKPQTRSFLRLNDIFNLDLPAELIVLSACESGRGEDVQGEGLVGLTRGFMYAGAARVTVSLWNAKDQSTKELMIAFYKQMLEQKKSPAAALNFAQRQMWLRKDLPDTAWKHPRYWAAFTMQGEWR
ncbi:MAG: tetratricopeptide repeat protein [Nostoc sp. GBBB01]|nr:tetratricopeptide repeat protein [Nostoc sp. GBBB01]